MKVIYNNRTGCIKICEDKTKKTDDILLGDTQNLHFCGDTKEDACAHALRGGVACPYGECPTNQTCYLLDRTCLPSAKYCGTSVEDAEDRCSRAEFGCPYGQDNECDKGLTCWDLTGTGKCDIQFPPDINQRCVTPCNTNPNRLPKCIIDPSYGPDCGPQPCSDASNTPCCNGYCYVT